MRFKLNDTVLIRKKIARVLLCFKNNPIIFIIFWDHSIIIILFPFFVPVSEPSRRLLLTVFQMHGLFLHYLHGYRYIYSKYNLLSKCYITCMCSFWADHLVSDNCLIMCFPVENYFSRFQHCLGTCNSLWSTRAPGLASLHPLWHVSTHIHLMFRLSCWWDFMSGVSNNKK